MNFLVYLGIINYDLPQARKDIVDKSSELILQSWFKGNYVFENYNANSGQGNDIESSDKFYHWGGLLCFIQLLDEGYFDNP